LVDNVYSPENEGILSYKDVPKLEEQIMKFCGNVITIHDKDLITKNI
jgi:hypothetical protein